MAVQSTGLARDLLAEAIRAKNHGFLMQYNDIPADAWYTEAVRWATSEGIVSGYDGAYNPDDPITREQFALMLYRYEQSKGGGVLDPQGSDHPRGGGSYADAVHGTRQVSIILRGAALWAAPLFIGKVSCFTW